VTIDVERFRVRLEEGQVAAGASPGPISDMMHASPVSLVVERKGEKLIIGMTLD
jgi:hypothetical protein